MQAPIFFGDAVWIKGAAGLDVACNRHRADFDAVRPREQLLQSPEPKVSL